MVEKHFEIVLATRNRGKLDEICALLEELPVRIHSLDAFPGAPEVEEDAPTLEGNARKKAAEIFEFTGLPTLADDTGLEVSALKGRPGVHSARFSGPEANDEANRRLLLSRLSGVENRTARFRTVAAFASDEGVKYFEGICSGHIGLNERGKGGFGYDSIFLPDGYDQTFAELPPAIKNQISHRGHALRKFVTYLNL